jgi:dinuclear metal center YbgI/SA1388 family protein
MRLREILAALEGIAPARYAFSFDRVGLQVGDPDAPVSRAVVSLDRSRASVARAREAGAQLLLAHHPLLFTPLKDVVATDHVGSTVLDLASAGIAFVAAHTNWDSAKGGVNDELAKRLGLGDLQDFGESSNGEQAAGRLGVVEPTTLVEFAQAVQASLGTKAWAWGDPDHRVRGVAVVGGAADGEWRAAQSAGADVLVTGEVKQHVALEASESGFALIAAGHYATEQPGVEALRDRMEAACPKVEWELFVPDPGKAGRPL